MAERKRLSAADVTVADPREDDVALLFVEADKLPISFHGSLAKGCRVACPTPAAAKSCGAGDSAVLAGAEVAGAVVVDKVLSIQMPPRPDLSCFTNSLHVLKE